MTTSKVKKQVQEILNKHKITEPPVLVEDIAKELGAAIIYRPFHGKEKVSGVLIREKNRIVIGINSQTSATRQRFSIAHELGHLLLHKGEIFVDVTTKLNIQNRALLNMRRAAPSETMDKKEVEANQFAAELLMPLSFIDAALTDLIDDEPDAEVNKVVSLLSQKFSVSETTMEYRLNQLGLLTGVDDF